MWEHDQCGRVFINLNICFKDRVGKTRTPEEKQLRLWGGHPARPLLRLDV